MGLFKFISDSRMAPVTNSMTAPEMKTQNFRNAERIAA
jgi:hypothetical protein